ncbi:hypothetical protein QFZ82_007561 [Streptomyces sp. V4I23]|nr:hypothetical protein [Streptomyces sp. V4I23]
MAGHGHRNPSISIHVSGCCHRQAVPISREYVHSSLRGLTQNAAVSLSAVTRHLHARYDRGNWPMNFEWGRLEYPPKAAVILVRDVAAGALSVPRIARQLRGWTVN